MKATLDGEAELFSLMPPRLRRKRQAEALAAARGALEDERAAGAEAQATASPPWCCGSAKCGGGACLCIGCIPEFPFASGLAFVVSNFRSIAKTFKSLS